MEKQGRPNAKMTYEQVAAMRSEYVEKPFSIRDRAMKIGVSRVSLGYALKGRSFKTCTVPPIVKIETVHFSGRKPTISDEVRAKIVRYRNRGFTNAAIARCFGINKTTVSRIANERVHSVSTSRT